MIRIKSRTRFFLRYLLVFLLVTPRLFSACAVDSQETGGNGQRGTASPGTYAFNNAAGTKLMCLEVAAGTTGGATAVSGITYNGVSMVAAAVAITWDSGNAAARWFYLDSPATGSHNIVYSGSASGSTSFIAGCISFTGTNTGVGTVTTGTGTSATPTASNITTASGNCIVAGGGWGSGAGGTAGTGFTRTWLINGSGSSGGDDGLAEYKISTGGATTPAFNITSDVWGIQAVELTASGGGGATPGANKRRRLRR